MLAQAAEMDSFCATFRKKIQTDLDEDWRESFEPCDYEWMVFAAGHRADVEVWTSVPMTPGWDPPLAGQVATVAQGWKCRVCHSRDSNV